MVLGKLQISSPGVYVFYNEVGFRVCADHGIITFDMLSEESHLEYSMRLDKAEEFAKNLLNWIRALKSQKKSKT